jgi:hypothetical protein
VPAKNLRVNIVLEKPLYEVVRRWARRDGVSLSMKVRDVVKAALELEEDRVLSKLAETREQSFDRAKASRPLQMAPHLRVGQRGDAVDVEVGVARLSRTFTAPVMLDPYQAVLLGQRLRAAGADVYEYPFTAESRRRLFGLLLQLVKDGHLRCFPHDDLRRELLSLEVQETSAGWRVDHRPGQQDDHVVATALAAHYLAETPPLPRPAAAVLRPNGAVSSSYRRRRVVVV